LFTCALGFSAALAPATVAGARSVQDVGATLGAPGESTTTAAPASATSTTAPEGEGTNQTLVEGQDPPARRLLTESRKVAAVVGALVLVALALLVLTIRYIRVTKPLPPEPVADGPEFASLPIGEATAFIETPAAPAIPTAPATPAVPAAAPGLASATASTPVEADAPAAAGVGSIDDAAIALMTATPSADHESADADWEPRTGEHQRIDIPSGSKLARPSLAARRRALGLPDSG
jgi:hypothetical protein